MNHTLKTLPQSAARFLDDETGVTAVEYGLLAALIAVVCIAGFQSTGTALGQTFKYWSDAVIAAIK